MAAEREHDVVLFGATGFTGGLTAEYLAGAVPEVVMADVTDPASLRAVAESSRVVATTVGPYLRHGEPLVTACAEAGADYLDLTGEPEFVDRTYVNHHARACETGARLVHCCGFDSIPHDLGALYTVKRLPEGVPLRVEGFVRAGGTFSAGTYHSALTAMSRIRQGNQAAKERKQAEAPPGARKARGIKGRPRHERSTRGCSPSRRSTLRSCCARRGRSSATAPTSPTATTSPCGACPPRPAVWPAWPGC